MLKRLITFCVFTFTLFSDSCFADIDPLYGALMPCVEHTYKVITGEITEDISAEFLNKCAADALKVNPKMSKELAILLIGEIAEIKYARDLMDERGCDIK